MARLIVYTLVLIVLVCVDSYAANLSIQPLYLEFKKMGSTDTKNFYIIVDSDSAAKVKVSFFKAKQDIHGKLSFVEFTESERDSKIIEIEKKHHYFQRAGKWQINGKINFPKKVNKTIVYALMIEEDKTNEKSGVSIKVRYAIVLKIVTNNRRIIEKGEFKFLNIGRNKSDDSIVVKTLFKNTSVKDYDVFSYARIYDNNRKYVGRVVLKSYSAWQKKAKGSIIFPDSNVELFGVVEGIKKPGTYTATFINKINNKRQIINKVKFEVSNEMIREKTTKVSGIEIKPTPIIVKYKKDKMALYRIQITNPNDFKITVTLPNDMIKDKSKSGYYSFFPNNLVINPRKNKKALFKVYNSSTQHWKISGLEAIVKNENGETIEKIPLKISFSK